MKVNFENLMTQILFISVRSTVTVLALVGASVLFVQGGTDLVDDTWNRLSSATTLLSGITG